MLAYANKSTYKGENVRENKKKRVNDKNRKLSKIN